MIVKGQSVDNLIAAYRCERTRGDPLRLENFGFKVYSQSDEGGIIAEIFRRIGTTSKTFIEFGCETGEENNTRLLLEKGWGGLWMEAIPDYAGAVRWNARDALAEGRLTFLVASVTRENVNDPFRSAGMKGEIDLLSIDIDGNDYHVFKAIRVVQPRVIVLEHNHSFAPTAPAVLWPFRRADDWVMPYDAEHKWSSGAPYGASIRAMHRLARRKGYTLVGCGLYSPNGFYVRADLVGDRFSGPFTPEHLWNPLNYEMIRAYPITPLAEPSVLNEGGHVAGLG